jgi:hypothetical protein
MASTPGWHREIRGSAPCRSRSIAQHAFLAGRAQQIAPTEAKPVLALVEVLDRVPQVLLGLADVHRPARRRRGLRERLLHRANAVLHVIGDGGSDSSRLRPRCGVSVRVRARRISCAPRAHAAPRGVFRRGAAISLRSGSRRRGVLPSRGQHVVVRLDEHAAAGVLQRHAPVCATFSMKSRKLLAPYSRSENVESSCSSVLLSSRAAA